MDKKCRLQGVVAMAQEDHNKRNDLPTFYRNYDLPRQLGKRSLFSSPLWCVLDNFRILSVIIQFLGSILWSTSMSPSVLANNCLPSTPLSVCPSSLLLHPFHSICSSPLKYHGSNTGYGYTCLFGYCIWLKLTIIHIMQNDIY